jgi:hypothetical protein
MEAFLEFKDINLADYIISPNWEIRGKVFPKNLRTTGDTFNQEFPDHENCFPYYRAYSQILFPKQTQSEQNTQNAKTTDIENLIDKKFNKILDSLPKNETKQNINEQNIILDSENKIIENKTNEIFENINNIENNLQFNFDNQNIQNIIEQKNIESRNINIQTVLELEKRLSVNEEHKKPVTQNDLNLVQQNIKKENTENVEMLKNKINEQKKFIEDFLNS